MSGRYPAVATKIPAMVVVRSDLKGLWLVVAPLVVVMSISGAAVEDATVALWLGTTVFGMVCGWVIHAALAWWFKGGAVLATDEGLVEVSRGQPGDLVPWGDIASVSVGGGNFWAFGHRGMEPGGVFVVLDRPLRSSDLSYPVRKLGSCLIVKHARRLDLLDEGRAVLLALAPDGVNVRP
jgi:hypothetical protein